MTDFASKYGFALAESSDSDDDVAAKVTSKENKEEEKKQPEATAVRSKFSNILKGLISDSDDDSDDADDILAKYRAKK